MFAIWSLAFWYGGKVVNQGHCDFVNMFKAISGLHHLIKMPPLVLKHDM